MDTKKSAFIIVSTYGNWNDFIHIFLSKEYKVCCEAIKIRWEDRKRPTRHYTYGMVRILHCYILCVVMNRNIKLF